VIYKKPKASQNENVELFRKNSREKLNFYTNVEGPTYPFYPF
jgi:hypothetical protein